MKYEIDGWNNFCRIFEIPQEFPKGFCFGNGIPTNFQMVDWFNPVSDLPQPTVSKEVWKEKVGEIKVKTLELEEIEKKLFPFLKNKVYIKEGRKYLIYYYFGAVSIFDPSKI